MVEEDSISENIKFCKHCGTVKPGLTLKGYENWFGRKQTGYRYCKSCWGKYIKPTLVKKIRCQCGECEDLIPATNKMGRPAKYKHGHNPTLYTEKGEKHPHWIGDIDINVHGYRMRRKPNHPAATKRGWVLEHRLIMEEYLGRYLLPKELVHHINEDKLDNRLENLKLVSRPEHTDIHRDSKTGRIK